MEANLYTALFIIAILVLSWSSIYFILHWVAIIAGKIYLNKKRSKSSFPGEVTGISVVKPLCGYDTHLRENLESFFKQDYPKFELILCVQEVENAPSIPIIDDLKTKYPHVSVRVFTGGEDVGPNPKINNMVPGYKNAQYPLLWLSDACAYVAPDTLTELSTHLGDPKIALVHQLPYVGKVHGFAGYLDKVYFGTQHSRMYLLAHVFSQNCVNGMSWLVKKDALEQVGGIQAFGEYLAEDFFMSQALFKKGWKFALSSKPAMQNQGVRSATAFVKRVTRWTKLRASMVPFPGLLEPFTECLFLAFIASLSVGFLFHTNSIIFFLCYTLLWFLTDLVLIKTVSGDPLGPIWLIVLAWLYREVITYYCFVGGLFNWEVNWRGKRYRLVCGGKAVKINEPKHQNL